MFIKNNSAIVCFYFCKLSIFEIRMGDVLKENKRKTHELVVENINAQNLK